MSVCAGLCIVASALVSCRCCHACEPVVLYEQQVVIAMVCVAAWCCSSMSIALHRAVCPVSLVSCVFSCSCLCDQCGVGWQSPRHLPLGRRAGGGHGVGGMRKACYLCQVEVVFQQRMCRLFCMALDVRLKALSLRGANCCVSILCVCVPCVRAAMPTISGASSGGCRSLGLR